MYLTSVPWLSRKRLGPSLRRSFCAEIAQNNQQPTNTIKHSIVYSSHTKIEDMASEELKLVPNFRTFAPSYSYGRGKLIFVSSYRINVSVTRAKILNIDTGASEEIELNQLISVEKKVPDTNYFLGFLVFWLL